MFAKLSPAEIDKLIENPDGDAKRADAHNRSSGRRWNEGLITAEALQSKQFKPVRIILSDLIPEGTTILAGKPKVGKSWLALDVCMAVAMRPGLCLATRGQSTATCFISHSRTISGG
jgi:hypothetical protein